MGQLKSMHIDKKCGIKIQRSLYDKCVRAVLANHIQLQQATHYQAIQFFLPQVKVFIRLSGCLLSSVTITHTSSFVYFVYLAPFQLKGVSE